MESKCVAPGQRSRDFWKAVVSEKLVRILTDQTAGNSRSGVTAGLTAHVIRVGMHNDSTSDDVIDALPETEPRYLDAADCRSARVGLNVSKIANMPWLGLRPPMGTAMRVEVAPCAACVRSPAVAY